jgi:proteasome lid subunit RPN8/RPN11
MDGTERTFILGALKETSVSDTCVELDDSPSMFAVHCSDSVLSKVMEHAVNCAHTEIFGLLLGDVLRTPTGKVRTIIRTFIPAQRLKTSTATFVEVSAEELIRMDKAYEEANHAYGMLKVGWFHTHPGHGIFMSATDRDNHAMYNKPWQVALVLDPIRNTSGFFVGPRCESAPLITAHAVLEAPRNAGVAEVNRAPSPKTRQWPTFILFIGLLLVAMAAALAYSKAVEALTRAQAVDIKVKLLQQRMEELHMTNQHVSTAVRSDAKGSDKGDDKRPHRSQPTAKEP